MISSTRSWSPYSASTTLKAPKALVSTTSTPASRKERWTDGDHVGAGQDDGFVAPFELGAAEVVGAEVGELQARAHGAVEDDDPVPGGLEVGGAALVEGHGAVRQHGRRSLVGVHGRGHDLSSLRPPCRLPRLATKSVASGSVCWGRGASPAELCE